MNEDRRAMQITVKVKAQSRKKPATLVRERVRAAAPDVDGCDVEEVFPNEQSGRRAGMVIVKLPASVSQKESDAVLRALRGDEDIEYAEPAAPRKAR